MDWIEKSEHLLARCIVCRGDIYEGAVYEVWEGGYYCEQHSVPHLRARARQYAQLLQEKEGVEKTF